MFSESRSSQKREAKRGIYVLRFYLFVFSRSYGALFVSSFFIRVSGPKRALAPLRKPPRGASIQSREQSPSGGVREKVLIALNPHAEETLTPIT